MRKRYIAVIALISVMTLFGVGVHAFAGNAIYEEEYSGATTEYSEDTAGYSGDTAGYSEDTSEYSGDMSGDSEDASGYSEEIEGYSRDTSEYSEDMAVDSRNTQGDFGETEEITAVAEEEMPLDVDDAGLPDSDVLLNGYLEQAAMEVSGEETDLNIGEESFTDIYTGGYDTYTDSAQRDAADAVVAAGSTGSKTLTDVEKRVYDLIREKVDAIAKGDLTSTQFELSYTDIFDNEALAGEYRLEDFSDVDSLGTVSGGVFNINESVSRQIKEKLGDVDFDLIISSLIQDYPFTFYWYDKTVDEGRNNILFTTVYTALMKNGEVDSVSLNTEDSKAAVSLCVSKDYSASDERFTYITNEDKTKAAFNAAQNAGDVVSSDTGGTDVEKLQYYKNWICENVEYDDAAVAAETRAAYGDPWQLINVFDGDSSTNVVCEGYSKAFKYLCDLTTFNNNNVGCYTVTGNMNGGVGEGSHMWNIVTMDDGGNYLVDVTNCDTGSIGYPNLLFLKGYTESNDPSESYSIYVSDHDKNVVYSYQDDMKQLYSANILSIADHDYNLQSEAGDEGNKTGDSGETGDDEGAGNDTSNDTSNVDVTVDTSGIASSYGVSVGAVKGLDGTSIPANAIDGIALDSVKLVAASMYESDLKSKGVFDSILDKLSSIYPEDNVYVYTKFLDISVHAYGQNGEDREVSELNNVIEIPLEIDLSDKENIHIVKEHNGTVTELGALRSRPADPSDRGYNDKCYLTKDTAYIYSNGFSVYTIGYTNKDTGSSSGSTGTDSNKNSSTNTNNNSSSSGNNKNSSNTSNKNNNSSSNTSNKNNNSSSNTSTKNNSSSSNSSTKNNSSSSNSSTNNNSSSSNTSTNKSNSSSNTGTNKNNSSTTNNNSKDSVLEDTRIGSHYYEYLNDYAETVWPDQIISIDGYPVGIRKSSHCRGSRYYDYDDDDDDDDDDYKPEKGDSFKAGSGRTRAEYVINGASSVRYESCLVQDSNSGVEIPDTVKIKDENYNVTSIAKGAFDGDKDVTFIVIGRKVKRINPKAFSGAPKLKRLIIRSNGLTKKKTKGALDGSKIKEIVVPLKRLDRYKRIFSDPVSGGSDSINIYSSTGQ